MKIPKWALKHRTKGTELRLLGGKYRLYRVSSRWDAGKKRAQKITGAFLGTVTEEGLIKPKVERLKESLSSISVLEWGAHHVVGNLNKDIEEGLRKYLPDYWQELWVASQIRFVYQAPIKNWQYHFEQSYLRELYSKVRLGAKQCTGWLKSLGSQREKIAEFLRSLSGGNEHILIDTTHVVTKSAHMEINHKGYNSALNFEPQVNLLYIFGTDTRMPVYYRLLPGNIRDVTAMQHSIEESGLKNVILVGDKGFYSEANVEALNKAELRYLLPLRRNNSLLDYSPIASGDKGKLKGHFLFNRRVIWYYTVGSGVTVFLDESLKNEESTDYLLRIREKYDGYSEEEFFRKQHQFGTLAIASNVTSLDAPQIFERYKARAAVEQAFDTYKNLLDADRTYMQGKEQMEVWSLLNFLALIYYYRLYNALLSGKLLDKYSVRDALIRSREYRRLALLGSWKTSEISSKTKKLLLNIGAPIT